MLSKEIIEKVKQIKEDREKGASELAIEAILIIGSLPDISRAKEDKELVCELRELRQRLLKLRPEMIAVTNNVFITVDKILKKYEACPENLKKLIKSTVEKRIKEYREERLKAVQQAASLIKDKDTVISCSYSSTVCSIFKLIAKQEKKINILVAESRFKDKIYGKILLEKLKPTGHPVKLIPDNMLEESFFSVDVDKVIVGADSVLIDGSLINGVPTLSLAKIAKKFLIPFYSVCEKVKFDILSCIDREAKIEPGFDLVPPELITAFVTEDGLIKPEQVLKEIAGINL